MGGWGNSSVDKVLATQCEFNAQNLCKKSHMVACVCNPITDKTETGRPEEVLASQASQRFSERPYFPK